jgi:hypothetical protein
LANSQCAAEADVFYVNEVERDFLEIGFLRGFSEVWWGFVSFEDPASPSRTRVRVCAYARWQERKNRKSYL